MEELDYRAGIPLNGPLVTLALAAAVNAGTLYTIPTNLVGTKTARIRKLHYTNVGAGDTWLYIGTGVGGAFVQRLPRIRIINNFDDDVSEDLLSGVEFANNITCYVDAAPTVEVQADVEEIG